MAYVTVAEYKAWLNALNAQRTQVAPDAIDAADYQIFVDEATAFIESETKRVFSAATATKYFDRHSLRSDDISILFTPDLLTVSAVTNGNGDTVSSSDYWAYPRNKTRKYAVQLKLDASAVWDFSDGYVAIAGTWGAMATPDTFVQRLTKRVAWWLQQTRTNTGKITTFGDGTREQDGAMPPDIMRDLNRLTLREVV